MTWEVKHPATGVVIGSVEETPKEHVCEIYERARAAFQTWSKLSVNDRVRLIRNLRLAIVEHLDEVVHVISESTGKSSVEALTTELMSVADALLHIEKTAHRVLRIRKVKTPLMFFGKTSYVEFKPRGVVLVISPWNFPFLLSVVAVAEALVGGNVVILKPSEVTPLVGKGIERLFEYAGFPEHVLQVVFGKGDLGATLVSAGPDYIHFTGSVKTGKIIQSEAAKRLIPTTLELGGKDPMIVFADANLERAVHAAVWGAFCNSGQVCMSVERVYVQQPVYDEFVRRVVAETERLTLGNGADDDSGSMTFPAQVETVRRHVTDALNRGARLLTGDHPSTWRDGQMFLKPMVIVDVTQDMTLMQDETFGPVLPILPFDTEEEAVKLANDTRYGLSASVFSSDLDRAKRVVSKLMTGNAVINDVIITIANPNLPYGGVKQGGIGAYHGETGIQGFCVRTAVMVDRGRRKREVIWFPYRQKYQWFAVITKSYWGKKRRVFSFVRAYLKLLSQLK
jgi:acyl-CoA reductase-like NAD-dependent aldehyde dehydrogenase